MYIVHDMPRNKFGFYLYFVPNPIFFAVKNLISESCPSKFKLWRVETFCHIELEFDRWNLKMTGKMEQKLQQTRKWKYETWEEKIGGSNSW